MMTSGHPGPVIRDFASLVDDPSIPLPTVCVVTGELVGPFKNGGLGTSMTGLAEFLAAHQAAVTVLYTGEAVGDLAEWQRKYAAAGIVLLTLGDFEPVSLIGPLSDIGWTNAWRVYRALRTKAFDVVHFNDTIGEGVYCFLAKRMGLAFENTLLCLALHSPTEWILESNGHPANWMGFCCFTSAERLSILGTDLLWGPSRYLLTWLTQRRYDLPDQVFNQQYVIPTGDLFGSGLGKITLAATPAAPLPVRRPTEIVFFGRLEERKGIRLFVNAITKLGDELARRGISVVFMGKPSSVNGVDAGEFLATRSVGWSFDWRIESGFDQRQAVTYLRDRDCVAVMASPVDNSPCTVYEALQFGVPFIAARTGGIPELIDTRDHKRHLFDYSVNALSEALLTVLNDGIANAQPAISVADNQARWLAMHRNWRKFLPPATGAVEARKWALVIDATMDASLELLHVSLASAKACLKDACTKIIVVQNGIAGPRPDWFANVEIVDELSDLTAQDLFDSLAEGDASAALFLRCGIEIDDGAREILEHALAAGPDAVSPMTYVEPVDAVIPMLPGSTALAMMEHEYDSGALVVCLPKTAARLGNRVGKLDRDRAYLGLADELYGADGEIWPLPEVLLTARDGRHVIRTGAFESRRNRALVHADRAELYQMVTIGRHFYRALTAVKTPQPQSAAAAIASSAINSVFSMAPARRATASRLILLALTKVYGDKGRDVFERLKRRVRARFPR